MGSDDLFAVTLLRSINIGADKVVLNRLLRGIRASIRDRMILMLWHCSIWARIARVSPFQGQSKVE